MLKKKEEKAPFLVLLIIDGWGIAPDNVGNIFSLVKTKNYGELILKYPAAALSTSPDHKKIISRSDNYFIIGTGGFLQKRTASLVEKLEKEKIKTLLISDQKKYPEMNFFFTGRKKIANNNVLTVKKDKFNQTTSLLTEALIKVIKKGEYKFIAAAFSDLESAVDSGDIKIAAATAEKIDESLKKIIKTILSRGGLAIITAGAGKAEAMINPQTEIINKKNTANPVPFILVGEKYEGQTIDFPEAPNGNLALVRPVGDISNIAPTILKIFGLPESEEIKSKSFI
jgi:2,3-bisphosphoglycerate-independent phosphoglycerate mutase